MSSGPRLSDSAQPAVHSDPTDLSEQTPTRPRSFPTYVPTSASAGFREFTEALRRLQDAVLAADPDEASWQDTARQLHELAASLEYAEAPEGQAPAGRAVDLPGYGHPLLPPWKVARRDVNEVSIHGHFGRFHLGANSVVHGGALPLLFDWLFALTNHAADRPLSRTAYLHVDYRSPVFIGASLRAAGRVASVDGRKTYLRAEIASEDGRTIMAEATALMVALQPHHD